MGSVRKFLGSLSQVHTLTAQPTYKCHRLPPPSCTSRSGVALICQEAEGGQIYNDSREQHHVTTVNIYTALTKDVAKVCRGSKPCRNYSQPHIINHLKTARGQWKAASGRCYASVLLWAPMKWKQCDSGYLIHTWSSALQRHAAFIILETPSLSHTSSVKFSTVTFKIRKKKKNLQGKHYLRRFLKSSEK